MGERERYRRNERREIQPTGIRPHEPLHKKADGPHSTLVPALRASQRSFLVRHAELSDRPTPGDRSPWPLLIRDHSERSNASAAIERYGCDDPGAIGSCAGLQNTRTYFRGARRSLEVSLTLKNGQPISVA
jgi:hypothetical protein